MVTVSQESLTPGSRLPRSARPAVLLAVATLGLGLNLRAWVLPEPHLHERFGVGLGNYLLLMGVPLLVAALVRLPVGVLTDRYGARVMFPVVSLVAAASVFGLGLADSLPAAVAASAVSGVGGAAFVVGGSLAARISRYGRRGLALGIFGLGPAVAVIIGAVSWYFDPGGRRAALVLGGSLVGFAGLAALVLRDHVAVHHTGSPIRRCLELVRLASTTSLSLLYALALGGITATAVYLPAYLATAFHLRWIHAVAVTGAVIVLVAVARLVGGWWTDRRPTARLLIVCYAVAAGLCLVVAVQSRLWWLTAPLIGGIAVCDGVASGALLAMIGKAARADSVGAVMGVTSAAGALGAVLTPLFAVALYVRTHGLRIGLGLPVRFEPEPRPTAMTVAVLGEPDTQLGAAAVVARLAELAASDELVIVYGYDERARPRLSSRALVAGLRDRLPRHTVVAARVAQHGGALGPDAALLGEFVEAGTLAVAVVPMAHLRGVAAELSSYLHADRMLVVAYTPAEGADLHEVWDRGSAAANSG